MKTIRNVALMLALAAGATSLAQAQTPAQAQPAASYHGQSLTRAEVRADLALWKRAGLERFWRGEASPDIYSREYRVAYAEYVRLRSGSTRPKCSARAGRADRRGGRRGLRHARCAAAVQLQPASRGPGAGLAARPGHSQSRGPAADAQEFALLAFLMQRPGEVYDAWQLAEQVWGMQLPVFERKNPKSHAVAIAVRRLRRKIDAGRSPACCTRCAAGPICWPLWIESASLDRPLWRFVELRGDAHDAVRRARTFPSQSHGVSHHASPAQYAHPAGAAPWASGMQAQAAATDPNKRCRPCNSRTKSPRPGNSNVKIPGP